MAAALREAMMRAGNLMAGLGAAGDAERFDALAGGAGGRVERIVSTGQASPAGFWYDQDQAEFVLLVAGAAALRIEGESAARVLAPGDWVDLPAHCRHRVEWTQADPPTVWLAVHYG